MDLATKKVTQFIFTILNTAKPTWKEIDVERMNCLLGKTLLDNDLPDKDYGLLNLPLCLFHDHEMNLFGSDLSCKDINNMEQKVLGK